MSTAHATMMQFESEIERAFESSPSEMGGRSRKEQLLWWSNFYQARVGEEERFRQFLEDDESPLCRIAGHVGSGKTTFTLEKLQRPEPRRICNGFWVDLSNLSEELRQTESQAIKRYVDSGVGDLVAGDGVFNIKKLILDAIAERLNRNIADRVRGRIHRHFLLLRSGVVATDRNLTRVDFRNRLEIDFPQLTETQDLEYRDAAWRDVAAVQILLGTDARTAQLATEALEASKEAEWPKKFESRVDLLSDYLRTHREILQELTDLKEGISEVNLARYWLDIYSRLFYSEIPILVLDNLDQMPNAELHSVIYDYVGRLALALKRTGRGAETSLPDALAGRSALVRARSFKLVYTVRDENIRSFSKTTGRSYKEHKIELAEKGEGYLKDGPPDFLPLDAELLYRIVERRLSFAKRQIKRNEKKRFADFSRTVEIIWKPGEEEDSPKRAKLLLSALSNHSIQIALSMVYQLTLTLLSELERDGRSLHEYLNSAYQIAFRGRVIDWLFQHDETGKPLAAFARRELDLIKAPEQRGHLCCCHRLILTLLHNRSEDRHKKLKKTTAGELIRHINRYTGTPEGHIKEGLFFLYQPQDNQRDYITICEGPVVRNACDIEDGHDVFINPRGSALLLQVLQRLEYWHRLAGGGVSGGTIFERDPIQAAEYIDPIISLVSEMAEAHKRNWVLLVKSYITGVANRERPFARYAEVLKLTVGDEFYLERVVKSHLDEVTEYLEQVFWGDKGSILLPTSERDRYLRRWPQLPSNIRSNPNFRAVGEKIRYYLENTSDLDTEASYAIEILGMYVDRYRKIKGEFSKMRSLSYSKTLAETE